MRLLKDSKCGAALPLRKLVKYARTVNVSIVVLNRGENQALKSSTGLEQGHHANVDATGIIA
jgi:hypothetical protein